MTVLGTFVVALLMGPLLLIGVGGLLLIAAALVPDFLRRVRKTFLCPWSKRAAFKDPSRVTCPKNCRELVMASFGLSRGVFPRWALISGGLVTWRSVAAPGR